MSSNKEKLWYEKQKNGGWKTLVSPLVQDQKIHAKFNNFIKIFYWKFREKKGKGKNLYPEVKFQGFGGFEDKQRAGHCNFDAKFEVVSNRYRYTIINLTIFVNQHYLLDKLGMPKLITDYQENSHVGWIPVGFEELIGTIAHEIAHAYQQTANNFPPQKDRSSCKSTGEKDANGNFVYPQLVAEHTQLTNEIKQLITSSSEYQNFKSWWKDGKPILENEEEENTDNEEDKGEENNNDNKKCPECNTPISENETYCSKCAVEKEKEFNRLKILLSVYKSPDLTTLEKNYQTVKKSSIYANENNKKKLDKDYNATKKYLQEKKLQQNPSNSNDNSWYEVAAWIGGGIILIVVVISLIFVWLDKPEKSKSKKNKK